MRRLLALLVEGLRLAENWMWPRHTVDPVEYLARIRYWPEDEA
jgi:hypothetical protein